jgi:hemoglobin/transferrin/lactoferrin receptor protein
MYFKNIIDLLDNNYLLKRRFSMRCIRLTLLVVSVFIILLPAALQAQTVRVLNQNSGQAVEDVHIYNEEKTKTALSNADGRADLRRFGPGDTIVFRHPSFRQLVISFNELKQNEFVARLSERVIVLDEVFVSASKREQDQTEIPRKIRRINTEDVALANPQTAADLLESSGEVYVQKSQMGGGSPMIRGFAANSVLIAVDGIRMNNAIFRSGNLQNVISVDPNALSGTEVIFGPGSIIYGSDALGGVMNFQTKDVSLALDEGETFVATNALARYGSANNERTLHADANLGYENWGFLSSVTYSNFDNLHSGGNFYDDYPDFGKRGEYVVRRNGTDTIVENDEVTEQIFSGYEQLNLMQKVRYKPSDDWGLNYGLHYATTSEIPRYDRLIEREDGDTGQLKSAEWDYGPQIWMLNALEVNHYAENGWYDNMNTVLAYQWFQESRNDRDFGDPSLRNREENVYVGSANFDFDKQLDDRRELFYGLDGSYNFVKSRAKVTDIESGAQSPTASRYPDGGSDYYQLAAYTKYQQELSARLTAIAGLRYSHVVLHSEFNSKEFYDFPFEEIDINTGALSGSLGLTYRPVDDLQLNMNASTGFRAPNVDDAAKVFDSEPGIVVVPNSDLKPEYSYNVDLAMIKNFGELGRLEVNVFYTRLEDAMVRRGFQFGGQDSIDYDGERSRVEAVVNAGQAYIYGASAGISADISEHIGFDSHFTYTNGRDISNGEPLRHVAPVFGDAGITYRTQKTRVRLYSRFNGRKNFSDFAPSERGKTHLYTDDGSPGWATLNVKASYEITKRITVNAGIENILDKQYRPYSSGISAAGRNFILALRAGL